MVSETTPMVLAEGHKHTMAVDQSALLEVLEALKAAKVDDRIRQAAETIYQRAGRHRSAWPHSPARQAVTGAGHDLLAGRVWWPGSTAGTTPGGARGPICARDQ